jgi:methylmalonyl-CoA decarboxylase subunit alpha
MLWRTCQSYRLGKFFELKPAFAKNIITCLARMDGRPMGIIANQPAQKAGTIDVNACQKVATFINFCDAFGIALIFFLNQKIRPITPI